MSLSRPALKNPAKHFFQWGGRAGLLTWWDKENKREVPVKLPFEFIVLDQLSTIGGFNKQLGGFWSNEVRNTKKEELYVRTKAGPFEAGLYEHLTETRAKGGKYTKTVYIAHQGEGGEWMLGCLKLPVSSALSAWIEFTNHNNIEAGKVVMTKGKQQESEMGPFFPPVFTWSSWTPEELKAATALDDELQQYLDRYIAAPKIDENGHSVDNDTPEDVTATAEQQADFEHRKQAGGMDDGDPGPTAEETAAQFELDPEEPINLDDIPF